MINGIINIIMDIPEIKRKKTRRVYIGKVAVGGGADITVQSMVKLSPDNEKEIIKQIQELEKVGCHIVRIALPTIEACDKIPIIKRNTNIPIVGDIHFDYRIAIKSIENGIDGIRLNPGNIREKNKVKSIVKLAKQRKIPIRVGVNSGSIDRKKYPVADADALVKSAMEHIKILEDENFTDIIVSLKSTDILTTVEAYEKFSEIRDYPLHIGITEAGTKFYGTIKSAIGIGILLYKGLGDTIRVSLSASPVEEVIVGHKILQALGISKQAVEVISCPTCGRVEFDVIHTAEEIERLTVGIKKQLKVAVMGCIVNGPGEAKDADIGAAGSKDEALLFVKGKIIKKIKPDMIVSEIVNYIRNYK